MWFVKMDRPEVVWEGYYFVWYNDGMCLVLEKAPPGKEKKELNLIKVQYHHYEWIEEAVEEDIDWLQEWKDAVNNNDTEDSYDDWKDNNRADIVSEGCDNFDPGWRMPGYNLYQWLRNYWDSEDSIYYEAQLEVVDEYTISSYEELMSVLDEDWINADDLNSELLLEINMYISNTTYRFVP